MVHPVQSVVESLYTAGRCPRLHVNALCEGVTCPDFIREQWQERLIIDLDSSYPLDLTFDETGIAADLSFGGYVTRCMFPWPAIYVVADRATGRGIVLDQNMPESVRLSRSPPSPEPLQTPPGVGPMPSTPATAPAKLQATDGGAAASEAMAEGDAVGNDPVRTEKKEEVKRRRASFRVIEGGG